MTVSNVPASEPYSSSGRTGPVDGEAPAPPPSGSRRAAMASTVGAIVDWYDFFLYGTAAALVFGPMFFPSEDPTVGVLASLGSFAVGFVFRPIGGAIFGHFGDRVGRRKMLVITILIMGLASTAIGLLPSYAAIGIAAPILLVSLRAVQGIAVGGEWGGAALMAVENAPKNKRNFLASGVQIGSFLGLLLGTLAFSIVTNLTTEEQFDTWGWRLPFLVSILFALVGLWIRSGVPESKVFAELEETKKKQAAPLLEALRTSPKQILAIIGMRLVDQSTFYIGFTFSLVYVKNYTDTPPSSVLTASMVALVLAVPTTSLWGLLADRFGARWFYIVGPLCAAAAGVPFFSALESGSMPMMILGFFILINLGHNISASVQQTWFTDMFDARIRYSGAGFGYAVAGAVGGFVPLTATALLGDSGNWTPVAILLAAASLVALVTGLWSYKWTGQGRR
ncbi:MFS transporter [Rhodococcus sp. ACPA1]|uniref:MFS transporter n=2 Tax=Rhodococcus TaxID=1827 RepID=UPI000BB0E2CD|nr:MFS transporter [Rhodococcus sp. ACPA1]PBC51632.1 MFS transporter [Rhodococcus sp. ACPA1]QSE85675.1 MHS family MFS transporter [Rhodococcus koreensis]